MLQIILDKKDDAEEVVERLKNLKDRFGAATVSDLNALVSVLGTYKDTFLGWTDLSEVRIEDGASCMIILPEPVPLKFVD